MHQRADGDARGAVNIGEEVLSYLQNRKRSGFGLRESEFFDSGGCGEELRLMVVWFGENQDIFSTSIDQESRQAEELMTQSLHRGSEFLLWQAESFEPVHEVVSQEQ